MNRVDTLPEMLESFYCTQKFGTVAVQQNQENSRAHLSFVLKTVLVKLVSFLLTFDIPLVRKRKDRKERASKRKTNWVPFKKSPGLQRKRKLTSA